MVKEDDTTTKRHHFGSDGRVISDEYVRSIKNLRRLVDEFDTFAPPEVKDGGGSGVSVADDVPTISPPLGDSFTQDRPVEFEAPLKFGHYSPDGCWWIPVKRDGHDWWLVLEPEAGMPRVQLWATDDDGRPVVTPGPPSSHFVVRADKEIYIPMLFGYDKRAIERRYLSG